MSSGSFTSDDGGTDSPKWNIETGHKNTRKVFTVKQFAMKRAAKRHKTVVPSPTSAVIPSVSSLSVSGGKDAFAFNTESSRFQTGKLICLQLCRNK